MSLSSLIVQREIATIRQVEEALARQVLYGGDLVTNLLEVSNLEEWRIAVTLADSYGLPAASPGELVLAPPEVLALLGAEEAAKRSIVPLSGNAQQLVVATSEPLSAVDLEQLAHLGLRFEPRIALYARVRQALFRAYGVPLERRIERLLTRLGGEDPTASSKPGSLQSAIVAQTRVPSVPPFQLSRSYGTSPTRSPLAPQNRESSEEPPLVQPPLEQPPLPVIPAARITQAGFPAPPSEPQLETPAPPVNVPGPAKHTTDAFPPVAAPEAAPESTFVKPTTNAVRPLRRRRGPLPFETAKEEVAQAADRDDLLDLFFEFARQYFDYSAMFAAHGDIAEGRDASGDGAPRERVVGIGIPLDLPSMFATAREKKTAVFARPTMSGVDGILLGDLGRADIEALVLPILVRDRTVALFYGDATGAGIDRAVVADVVTFAGLVGQGFERLIVRKKLGGFAGGAPQSQVGKLEATTLPLPTKSPSNDLGSDHIQPGGTRASRAAALGRALFGPSNESSRPGAFRGDHATQPETPQALGAVPNILQEPEPPPVSGAARRVHPSNTPPPPQASQVRRPSGPPIPREDPGAAPAPTFERARVPAFEVISVPETAPTMETGTLDDDEAQALLEEIASSDLGVAEGEEVLIDIATPQTPESEQAMWHGPRRPKAPHSEATLPSIIVDIASELSVLVERVLSGQDDGAAEGELLRQGASAMPAIMARFPGPLTRARSEITEPVPRASDCGPLLRLITRQRKVALVYVLEEVAAQDIARRFWATFLLAELPYGEACRTLVPRLFDPDQKVRLVARVAARALAETAHESLLGEMARILREPSTSRTARLGLLEALGDLRESLAVQLLIQYLPGDDAEVATVARRALIAITRQDYGLDPRLWLAWWGQNSSRHRIEWLIDALESDTPGIRRAAGDELKALTNETFGYYDDLPKRERERAQQRFRDWWASEGRSRFVRS